MQLLTPREPGLERESVSWFTHIWPRTQRPEWTSHRPLNAVQGPGEVIFVPGGWWHGVLNLDLTVAVTHNYCSSSHFEHVWRHTKVGRPKLSLKWLEVLRTVRSPPGLVSCALQACMQCSSDVRWCLSLCVTTYYGTVPLAPQVFGKQVVNSVFNTFANH